MISGITILISWHSPSHIKILKGSSLIVGRQTKFKMCGMAIARLGPANPHRRKWPSGPFYGLEREPLKSPWV